MMTLHEKIKAMKLRPGHVVVVHSTDLDKNGLPQVMTVPPTSVRSFTRNGEWAVYAAPKQAAEPPKEPIGEKKK